MASSYSGRAAYETFGTTSAVTGSAPSASTDGMPCKDLDAVHVVAVLGTGATFSGAGTLDCYGYHSLIGAWYRIPGGDFTFVGAPSSQRRLGFGADPVLIRNSARLKWVPTGVTFGGGGSAGVTVYMIGENNQAKGV